jgi:DNA-binding NarL/FixJ family response regulator
MAKTLLIAIADDEDLIRKVLKARLSLLWEMDKNETEPIFEGFSELMFREYHDTFSLERDLVLNENEVDVLILDNYFQGSQTGIEVLPRIREIEPIMPIILLTSEQSHREIKKAEKYIGNNYVYKGITEGADTSFIVCFSNIVRSLRDREKRIEQRKIKLAELKRLYGFKEKIENGEKIANLAENDDLLIEEFSKKLLEYSDKIKEDEKEKQADSFKKIKDEFIKRYEKYSISKEVLDFLINGEFFYQLQKRSEIEGSSIILYYCKALECLITEILRNKVGTKNTSLGRGAHRLVQHKLLTEKEGLVLKRLNDYRSMAAHKGIINNFEVLEFRYLLFGENKLKNRGILEKLLQIKKEL